MSVEELKRTVTRPYRFQRAVVKQSLATRTPVHLKVGNRPQDVVLIPGGRWLVVAVGVDRPWPPGSAPPVPPGLQVWDIRAPIARNLSLVASTRLKSPFYRLFIQPPATEEEGEALIFVSYRYVTYYMIHTSERL